VKAQNPREIGAGIYMVAAMSALLFAVGLPSVEIAREGADVFDDAGVDSRAGYFFDAGAAAGRTGELCGADDFLSDRSCNQLYRSAGDRSGGSMADLFAAVRIRIAAKILEVRRDGRHGARWRSRCYCCCLFLPGCVTESRA